MLHIHNDAAACLEAGLPQAARKIVLDIRIAIGKPNTFVNAPYARALSPRGVTHPSHRGFLPLRKYAEWAAFLINRSAPFLCSWRERWETPLSIKTKARSAADGFGFERRKRYGKDLAEKLSGGCA